MYKSLTDNIEKVKKMRARRVSDFFFSEQHDEIFIAGLSVIENHN